MDLGDRLRAALADRYEIEREIGRGGMGVVFRARDLRHSRPVAIKVLRPELAAAVGPERFDREVRIEAQLQHPHIIPLFDSGSADGMRYFVMPFIEGETLRARLLREKQLPLEDALDLADEVADALGYAHARGVVHRDVKPENILIAEGHALVADFGIARAIYEGGESYFTATGTALGTPPYMSPEQATGSGQLDGRSDLYSLACVLYEMLAGEPPFSGPSPRVVISKHLFEPPPSVEIVRPSVTPVVGAAIQKGLAKVPADRFATAAAFRAALRAERPVRVPRPPLWPRIRRPLVAAIVIAIAVIAGLLVPRVFRPKPPLAGNRVVVFPLAATIPGVDEAGIGWEAALAIEAALEHTEPLRWLDGWSFLPADIRAAPRLLTPAAAETVTRAAGARYFLTGVVRGDSTNPAVTLWLHDAAADSVVLPATEAGVGTSVALLAVRALEQLLVPLIEPGRKVDLTPLTQRAQGAVALMLQGDRAYRSARFLEALDLYKRAVRVDSLMVLAAVKGAQAANWAALTEPEAEPLIEQALRADSLMPPRYRAFARGLRAYLSGQGDTAIARLREALRGEPAWPEAWMALGEVFYHLMPSVVRFDSLAEDAFRRSIAADSTFSPPLLHLAEISARRGDVGATRDYVRRFRRIGTDSTYGRELRLVLGCLTDGPRAAQQIEAGDSVGATFAAVELAAHGARLDCAELIERRLLGFEGFSAGHRVALLLSLQSLLMAQGRYADLEHLLDSAIGAGYLGAHSLYLYDYALGAPVGRGATAAEQLIRERAGPTYERARQDSRWLVALYYLRRSAPERAAEVRSVMSRVADSSGALLDRLYVDAIDAHLALAASDTAAALRAFTRLHGDLPALVTAWLAAPSLLPTRLLQAKVLLALGREREADSIIALVDHREPVVSSAALPYSLALEVRMADATGDRRRGAGARRRLEQLGWEPEADGSLRRIR